MRVKTPNLVSKLIRSLIGGLEHLQYHGLTWERWERLRTDPEYAEAVVGDALRRNRELAGTRINLQYGKRDTRMTLLEQIRVNPHFQTLKDDLVRTLINVSRDDNVLPESPKPIPEGKNVELVLAPIHKRMTFAEVWEEIDSRGLDSADVNESLLFGMFSDYIPRHGQVCVLGVRVSRGLFDTDERLHDQHLSFGRVLSGDPVMSLDDARVDFPAGTWFLTKEKPKQ